MSSSYLVADGISHGIRLDRSSVLEYLYYLKQIGMAVSPISNNKLFMKYHANPFPKFFKRGLNVSLSTDDPLILHMTSDPLLEEYAVASEVWGFSSVDLCEIARNSVLQSGFEDTLKKHWIGDRYKEMTKEANNVLKTNIPMARFQYRIDTYHEEMSLLVFLSQDPTSTQ
jgi:AMP deaminase